MKTRLMNKKGIDQALLYLILTAVFIVIMIVILTRAGQDGGKLIDLLPFF